MGKQGRYELYTGHKGGGRGSPGHRAATGPKTAKTCLIWDGRALDGCAGRKKGCGAALWGRGVAWALGMAQGVLGRVRGGTGYLGSATRSSHLKVAHLSLFSKYTPTLFDPWSSPSCPAEVIML